MHFLLLYHLELLGNKKRHAVPSGLLLEHEALVKVGILHPREWGMRRDVPSLTEGMASMVAPKVSKGRQSVAYCEPLLYSLTHTCLKNQHWVK